MASVLTARLPRLLAQPIHRDDVVNGKFVAGLTAITLILIAVVGIIAAIGIIQLGILPGAEDVLRLMVWVIVTVAPTLASGWHWPSCARCCSEGLQRQHSWLCLSGFILTVFLSLIVGIVAGVLRPVPPDATAGSQEVTDNLSLQIGCGA